MTYRVLLNQGKRKRRHAPPGVFVKSEGGFTLIEAVIYLGLFVLLTTIVALFYLGVFRSSLAVRAEEAAVANAALTLRYIDLETRQADSVYTPTSVFSSDSGQLSLRTPRLAPTDHPFAYTDFYLDNGILYERRDDGTAPVALTSGDTLVSVFRAERKTSGNIEGIRLTVTAVPQNIDSRYAEAKTLRTFIIPRSFSP